MKSAGLFKLGDAPPPDATSRLGAKGAALAALAAGGVSTPPGFVIEASSCAAIGDVSASVDAELWPAVQRAIRNDPELAAAPLALRLSSETVLEDLAPALLGVGAAAAGGAADEAWAASSARYGNPARDVKAAVEALVRAWRGPKALRRRAAVDAADRFAVIVHRYVDLPEHHDGLKLWSPEDGGALDYAAAPAGLAAALDQARQAERVMRRPLELDCLSDPNTGSAVLVLARPFRGTARAAVAAAVAMAEQGVISQEDAVLAAPADRLQELLHARVADTAERREIGHGLPASPGAASGRLAFHAVEAAELAKLGDPVILARRETTPEDVHAMSAAAGVLTTRGGLTSHAAVVARGLGLPAIVGAADLRVEEEAGAAPRLSALDGRSFGAGDWITLDAGAGVALEGAAPIESSEPTGSFKTLMSWADARRRLKVRANADTPAEVENAGRMGVDGVGLCRTEHMFFAPERISAMRRMILADTEEERRAALEMILPMQRADFERIFEIVIRAAGPGAPATIRLLDPPLHEFLPRDARGIEALAEALGASVEKAARRARDLREDNPMLGKRGCRLGVAYPEIYEMQARAIFEAALAVRPGPRVEIMVPLVSAARELELLKNRIDCVAEEIAAKAGADAFDYCVGIMVETPRAALRADALARLSSFFSFGTNDLTQMTYGLSRDDAGRLMRTYVERGVFEADPFASLDVDGVGELIRIGVERGRAARADLTLGMCGEHGGSPAAIDFCEEVGFDYVSCSPFRAPIARLAAAQAAIRAERQRLPAGYGAEK